MSLHGAWRCIEHGGSGNSEGGSLLSCYLTSTSSSTTEAGCKPKGAVELDGCDWRSLKMARTEAMAPPFDSVFSDGEQMLCFSATSKEDDSFALACDGLYSGCHDVIDGNGVSARAKGPFTPSQWLELEHQALVYKYIVAKVPIPPNLLAPIQRSLSRFSAGSLGSSEFGWGSFYLGCSAGNVDPEQGRCRRTDGKKWRCSRDAVADQKYCERHINRGRRRSRKHVEAFRSDHAAKAMTMSAAASPSQSASPVSGSRSHNSNLRASQSQTKTAKSAAAGGPRPAPLTSSANSERTQLSMWTPMASSEFSSSTAPNHESDTDHLPLELCRMSEAANQRQASWIPIFWEASGSSMGDPLGEALKNTNNKTCSSSTSQ